MFRTSRSTARGAAANLGVCILAGCALIAAATWASGDSTPRRLARGTHVGVAPSDTVVLSLTGAYGSQKFVQVHEDGTIDTAEYTVPAGRRLFVTDVDWTGPGPSFRPALRMFVENRTTSTTRNMVYTAFAWVNTSGSSGSTEFGGINSGILTGFSVAPSARLVCDVVDSGQITNAFTTSSTRALPVVIVRGYVVIEE